MLKLPAQAPKEISTGIIHPVQVVKKEEQGLLAGNRCKGHEQLVKQDTLRKRSWGPVWQRSPPWLPSVGIDCTVNAGDKLPNNAG